MKVKICCISSIAEAEMSIAAGADYLGLVGNMPSGPGIISDHEIAKIVKAVGQRVQTILLTSETTVEGILSHYAKVKTSCIQIVDTLPKGSHVALKIELPKVKLFQVLHVNDETVIDEAVELGISVDYILLDSGKPNAKRKTLGGTGNTHNWEISAELVQQAKVPVFLAGGLNEENVSDAMQKVKPFGLDLCSGVRTDSRLDKVKLKTFFEEVHG